MADQLHDLQRLAPVVDVDQAKAAFRSHRRRSHRVRIGVVAAAAVLFLAAGTAVVITNRDDPSPVTAGPAATEPRSGPVMFEVLVVAPGADEVGTLRVATTEDAFSYLWERANAGRAEPVIDLAAQVVVSITIPDDLCPPELTTFVRDDDVITPVFVEPEGDCRKPLVPRTFVVAIDRASLGASFTLHLPAGGVYGYPEQWMAVVLHPSEISHGGLPTVWAIPPGGPSGEQAGIGGTLMYDEDLDCFFLGDGRDAVVWPAGTVGTWDGPGVVLPGGHTIRAGDSFSGVGGGHPGSDATLYGIASECVTDTLVVVQFSDVEVVAEGWGRVLGAFVAVGGPAPGVRLLLSGTITVEPVAAGITSVEAVDGGFGRALPPGTYHFAGTSSQYQNGATPCPAPDPVVVRAGETTTVEIVCQMK